MDWIRHSILSPLAASTPPRQMSTPNPEKTAKIKHPPHLKTFQKLSELVAKGLDKSR